MKNMCKVLKMSYRLKIFILFTLWASLKATTQQVGKADATPSSALPSDRGR
jgi:hypothetical protein